MNEMTYLGNLISFLTVTRNRKNIHTFFAFVDVCDMADSENPWNGYTCHMFTSAAIDGTCLLVSSNARLESGSVG